jgi:hypothetical protein
MSAALGSIILPIIALGSTLLTLTIVQSASKRLIAGGIGLLLVCATQIGPETVDLVFRAPFGIEGHYHGVSGSHIPLLFLMACGLGLAGFGGFLEYQSQKKDAGSVAKTSTPGSPIASAPQEGGGG